MARWWLLKKRVRRTILMYGEFPHWTPRRCWVEAGNVQRWSLIILAQFQEADEQRADFITAVEATINALPVREVLA